MKVHRAERLAFTGSLAFFAFLYGWGAGALGWFPGPQISDGFAQGRFLLARPGYLVPRTYERSGIRQEGPSSLQPGSTLIATVWPAAEGQTAGLKLVSHSGEVLHQWRIAPAEIFSAAEQPRGFKLRNGYVHGAHLFENGDVIVNVEAVGSARLDACSRVMWKVERRNHHSVAMADDGSFWIPVLDYLDDAAALEKSGHYPGLSAPLVDNRIVRLSPEGEVVEEIAMLDVLYANGLERHLIKSGLASGDVLHLNDVEPLSDSLAAAYPMFQGGDLLVSLRNAELVLVMDPTTGIVRWHASDPFIQQHDPDFIGDGWIALFDNNADSTERGSMLGGSRIVALQPHTDSVTVLFPTTKSDPFYTRLAGKWQLLANGNLLLTESQTGRVVEVGADGRTLWEWIHEPVEETWVAEVSEGTRYPLTSDQVAGWPCSESSIGREAEE